LPIDLGVNESPVFAIDQGDKVVIGVVIKRDGHDGIRVVRRALDGTADPSFGSAGEAFLDVSTLGLATPLAGAVAQADGKIVVAGAASNGSDVDPFIVRLTADGQIDSALALRKIDSTTANLGFSAIDVGPGGELVIAGTKSLADTSDLYFLRLDSTGARDPGFGANGLATFHDLKFTQVSSFVIQTDGRIVGLVQTLNSNGFDVPQFALRRFGTDGALDTTFGTAGKATLPTPEGLAFANTLASPDRLNLFVGGSARGVLLGNSDTAVWKFASDGRLDLTFGGGIGYYVAAPTATPADSVSRLVFAADGSIYGVGSESESFSLTNTLLLHLEANGAPATDFGDGLVRHPAAALTTRAAYLRADHRLILVMAPIFPADANDTVLEAFFQ
ncbi:MAG: hypothetical protein ABI867_42180, partial [Kofleriaceae bacterium]